MQRLTLDIPAGGAEAGEGFVLLGNVSGTGRATDSLVAIGAAAPVVPLGAGAAPAGYVGSVTTPALYFGRYRFSVRSQDAIGNVTSDADREFAVIVNSGPRPASQVRHSATVAGRPVFSFTAPGQFR